MLTFLPLPVLNLGMGSPAPHGGGVNFVEAAAIVSGAATPYVAAYQPPIAAQVVTLTGAVILDRFAADLSTAGYTRNGAFFLTLAASTPVTVDLTDTAAAVPATAGDVFFGSANEIIFYNPGSRDVTVSPGAANPFAGPLGGSAPTFAVPAGARLRWHSPAGWPVTSVVKNLKFDPGAGAATIGVSIGGGF